jgi:hypothetical protein
MAYFTSLVAQFPDFPDGLAALAVMHFDKGDSALSKELWEQALEGDSRYLDVDWVQNIRRWPPKLVDSLISFKAKGL